MQQSELVPNKVYWSDRDFIFRRHPTKVNWFSCYLHTSERSKAVFTEGTMNRNNFSEPTPLELAWFAYCEFKKQYITYDAWLLLLPEPVEISFTNDNIIGVQFICWDGDGTIFTIIPHELITECYVQWDSIHKSPYTRDMAVDFLNTGTWILINTPSEINLFPLPFNL